MAKVVIRSKTNYFVENSQIEQLPTIDLDKDYDEKKTGFPNPKLYDQYFINTYSLPKGLQTQPSYKYRPPKISLYDFEIPKARHGVSGWKLTRRPNVNYTAPEQS